MYLALITDKYSRKIVGWHVGDSLEAVGCVRALERALAELPAGSKPIHHSDQGSQYCCHEYVKRLQESWLGDQHDGDATIARRMRWRSG